MRQRDSSTGAASAATVGGLGGGVVLVVDAPELERAAEAEDILRKATPRTCTPANSETLTRAIDQQTEIGAVSEPRVPGGGMENDGQLTCGKGLAANAGLAAKLGVLIGTRAEVLERHTRALDLSDPSARQELDAYTALVRAHRDIAARLEDLAREMAGCRDLAMARHDMAAMADPAGQSEAFQRFVAIERELLELLRENVEQEEKLLA